MTPPELQRRAGDRSTVFDALSDPIRRRTVHLLAESGAELALADLAADLASGEGEAGDPDWERAQRRLTELYHVHVPKLADAGIVTFDGDLRTVELDELARTDFVETDLAEMDVPDSLLTEAD